MGFDPKFWGPEAWWFIHLVALNYPINPSEEDKKNYTKFFESLKNTLPCPGCAFNFGEKLKKTPPRLENREQLFNWTVDVHNEVNKSHGKPEISYEEALKKISEKKDIEKLRESFMITSFTGFMLILGYLSFVKK
jgi:hypothetical protein